jgi:hypothetical protein
MWRRGIIHLIVVALLACVATAGQPEQATAGASAVPSVAEPELQSAADPNQTWDPSAHLVGGWTSATRTTHADRNLITYRYLSVDCAFTIVDPNSLVGLDAGPIVAVLALDENAKVFHSSTAPSVVSYRPLQYARKGMADGQWRSELQPYSFSVMIPLEFGHVCPLLISRLEVPVYALVAGAVKNVDLPFQANPQWVDVAPGLQVLVEKADITGTRYEYSIEVKYDPGQVDVSSWSRSLFRGDPAEVIVTKIDILDAQGKSIRDQSTGIFLNGATYPNRGLGDMTATGSGDCNLCGGAATIRFVLALDSYEREIRLVLQNIPVPILW